MATGRVTLRDVAARAGVHASTVSRVLNPERRDMVSPEVAARVTAAAQLLGYYPNAAASGLRTRRSLTVGVVVTDIANPLFAPLIRGIEDCLIETGYTSIVCSSDQRSDRKQRIVEIMRSRHLDGMILTTTERDDPVLRACLDEDMPVVLVQHGTTAAGVPAIRMNDRLGTRYVIDHLLSLGHRRIALVSGPQRLPGAFERHRLSIRAMVERGIELDPALAVFTEGYGIEDGIRACGRLLDSGAGFTAIAAAADFVAVGCCEALAQRGLACPDDVSVTGYNALPFTKRIDPPLTTVRFDRYEAGMAAAELLLHGIGGRDGPAPDRTMQPTLVIGATTAAPRA